MSANEKYKQLVKRYRLQRLAQKKSLPFINLAKMRVLEEMAWLRRVNRRLKQNKLSWMPSTPTGDPLSDEVKMHLGEDSAGQDNKGSMNGSHLNEVENFQRTPENTINLTSEDEEQCHESIPVIQISSDED
ncbi:hypothetical protein KR009_009967 [Drosophila setifemur]|nr:hypothetical protein KR009_009967 [Drosophila setifemur]